MAKIDWRNSPSKKVQQLTLPLTKLKGIGPQRASLLAHKGLQTILDLLFFLPTRYEDRTRLSLIEQTRPGERAQVKGQVVYGKEEGYYRSRKRLFRIIIRDESSDLELTWFHYQKQYLSQFIQEDKPVLVYGLIQMNKGRRQMIHPEISLLEEKEIASHLGFYPVYSEIEGLSANTLRKLINNALEMYLSSIVDPIPPRISHNLGLPPLTRALKEVHNPPLHSNIDRLNRHSTLGHKRLCFDRFFLVMVGLIYSRQQRLKETASAFCLCENQFETFKNSLPFSLTKDQVRAIQDIRDDFKTGNPMYRLLVGDVGCGKTVVAAVAAYTAAKNNKQTAFMAPTQILARQHLEFFKTIAGKLGLQPLLLISGLTKNEQENIYKEVRTGKCNLLIGTHALIQDELVFKELGLVIIDEQQRFGVQHRALIGQKADHPHQLIMTATPIPRTLAVTLYGDMDLSMIKTRPVGHKPVQTRLMPRQKKREVFDILNSRVSSGQQAFVICPVIEGSDETELKDARNMVAGLRKILSPKIKVGLVHGRLASDEKQKIMKAFREGEINILVGTTVLEVGVDVPKATLMIIEHPERFGLSQLHQLRGRVGRGLAQGLCLLVFDDNIPQSAVERLKTLEKYDDGFIIAEKDLELRGHGELTGLKQSGLGEINLFEMLNDPELLMSARQKALDLIHQDPDLSSPEHSLLKILVTSRLAISLDI